MAEKETSILVSFESSSYPCWILLTKGFTIICLCAVMNMPFEFWNLKITHSPHFHLIPLPSSDPMILVLLLTDNLNSPLITLPIGQYWIRKDLQPLLIEDNIFHRLNYQIVKKAFTFDHVLKLERTCYHLPTVRPFNIPRNQITKQVENIDLNEPFSLGNIYEKPIRMIKIIGNITGHINIFYQDMSVKSFIIDLGCNIFCNCTNIITHVHICPSDKKFMTTRIWKRIISPKHVDLVVYLENRLFHTKRYSAIRNLIYNRILPYHRSLDVFNKLKEKHGIFIYTVKTCVKTQNS